MRKFSLIVSLSLFCPLLFALVSFVPMDTAHAIFDNIDMTTQHNDNQRTGANLKETTLNTTNVNQAGFGKLFSKQVDGHIYAQPLYLSQMNIGGKVRNVVFIATMHNTIYCFDTDDSSIGPIWSKTLAPSVLLPDTNIGPNPYHDVKIEIGHADFDAYMEATIVLQRIASQLGESKGYVLPDKVPADKKEAYDQANKILKQVKEKTEVKSIGNIK